MSLLKSLSYVFEASDCLSSQIHSDVTTGEKLLTSLHSDWVSRNVLAEDKVFVFREVSGTAFCFAYFVFEDKYVGGPLSDTHIINYKWKKSCSKLSRICTWSMISRPRQSKPHVLA